MKYRRLRAVEDVEFGGLGLKFVIPHKMCNGMFTAQTGLVLAHDIVEHQQGPGKIGSIGDEMIALGGICYTRAQYGDMSRDGRGSMYYSAEESIASDITNMARLYFENKIPFRQRLQRSRGEDRTLLVDDVIEAARASWDKSVDTDEPVDAEQRDSYLESCRIFMLHGVKMADRRFGSGGIANHLFWNIEQKVDSVIRGLDFEGQEFALGYNLKGDVRISEVAPEEF